MRKIGQRKKKASDEREIISRSGLVTRWGFELHAWAVEDRKLDKRFRRDSPYIDLTGVFTEAVSGIKDFSIMICSDGEEASAGRAEIPCVGTFLRSKPVLEAVVTVSARDFKILATFAAVERISAVDLTFQKPRYGSGLISSALFSTKKVID